MALAALTKPASSFTQTGCGFDAGIFQDWNHADNKADENSQPRRKKKDRVIYADLVQARGAYPPPPGTSDTLGLEVSGTIAELGEGVTDQRVGEEVCALLAGGGYAEFCTAPVECILPIPKGIALVTAASLPEVHFTVWTNLFDSARLRPGERVLIHGGSSGIGTAAIQLCAARGHEVFTTAGSAEKCAACERLGATRAINYRTEPFQYRFAAANFQDNFDACTPLSPVKALSIV